MAGLGKLGTVSCAGKDEKASEPLLKVWKTRSVFWDLEYWPILDTPYCLDQMHITKNVLESLLATVMNMPDKTKDGPKARRDLEDLNIRADLHMPPHKKSEETEMETEEGEGAEKLTSKRRIIAPFLLHLKCEGDRSIHQVPYGNQSQFWLLWEDKQISRPQEEKVQRDEVS
jgi:hypothetical protein